MADPNLDQLLAEAQQIQDPVKREARINQIYQMMLGTYRGEGLVNQLQANADTSAITADPVEQLISNLPEVSVPATTPAAPGPTIENAQKQADDQEYLVNKAKLGDKILTPNRPEAFSDDELEAIINNPNAAAINPGAQEELDARHRNDADGIMAPARFDPADMWEDTKRLAGQVVGGAAEIPTSGPISLVGLAAKGAELIPGVDLNADEILKAGSDIREQVRQGVGISEPRNIRETIAGLLPSITPVGGSVAGPLQNAAEVLTPLVIGGGNKRIMANFMTGFLADQTVRKLSQGKDDPYETIFGKTTEEPAGWKSDALKALLIGTSALTAGSIVTPVVAKALRETKFMQPPTEPVAIDTIDIHAPKDLFTLETAGDLYKTQLVDDKTVLKSLYARSGTSDPDFMGRLIDNDTATTALMRVNEAMRTGALRTNTGSFQVDITPNQLHQEYSRLPPQMQEDADQYMKNLDYAEVLKSRIAKKKDVDANSNTLRQVEDAINTLRTRTPVVEEFAAKYRHITGAVRDFLSQGENAMLSKKTANNLTKFRSNFVPNDVLHVNPNDNLINRIVDAGKIRDQQTMDNWYRQKPDGYIDGIANKANAFEMLNDYTRNALKAKMEHDVRGKYVRGMQESDAGSMTMRPATDKEVKQFPDRIVKVWEDGKRKSYISSKLQSQLLRFDPYHIKFPTAYAAKRLFENATTGPLSLTFAPVTAIRDLVGGFIQHERGTLAPTPLGTTAAVGQQIWAKANRAAADVLQNKFQNLPFIDENSKRALAQMTASSYMNSYYHLANAVGGFDASLTKQGVQQGRGRLREVMKSLDATGGKIPGARFLGRNLQAMIHGWETVFDAVSEAPRFATFVRNVKAGMDPSDAVTLARNLTGDTTRSGKPYNIRGQRIEADAINKGATIASPLTGFLSAAFKDTTPYYNPMIQSMRKLMNSYIDDPVGTNLRAWATIGLPSATALGWNEMLGEEYNRYAFEGRSSRDIATNLYIGIPGLSPDRGIQIPMPLELGLYNSPFSTALYSMMKGGDVEDVNAMMMHMAGTTLENSAMVGFPQIATQGAALMGMKMGDASLINPLGWQDEVYKIDENTAGMLPSNVEAFARSLFGNVAEMAIQSASAFHDGGPSAFFDELGHTIEKRIPIVKNLTGNTPYTANFTPESDINFPKQQALWKFMDLYDEFVDKDKLLRENTMPTSKGLVDDDAPAYTRYRMAPHTAPTPTNPVVREYGDYIKSIIDSNSEGATGLKARDSVLKTQIKNLKGYTAGRKDAFRAWQKDIIGSDAKYQAALADLDMRKKAGLNKKDYEKELKSVNTTLGEPAKVERLYKEMKIDLGDRTDVLKLIGRLNEERTNLSKQQMKLINMIEDQMTTELQQKGMLQPGVRFDVTKHLGSLVTNDFVPPTVVQGG